jgi:hypothetical protein
LLCDNESAERILKNPVVDDRSKYAELHAHFVRELVEREELVVIGVDTEEMVADCMTKALSPGKHGVACGQLKVG